MGALAVQYDTTNGLVELDEETVRNYLVNGNGRVTNQEVAMFIKLCQYQGLNPFLREAYLIKYSDKAPATTVVGKDAFTRRAAQIEECKGWRAGVGVVSKRGEYIEREGTITLPDERLVGGWCEVKRSDWEVPFKSTAALNEYDQGNSMWKGKPATMIRKVAIVQALREAFPDKFQGMYDQSEMSVSESLPESEVPQEVEQRTLSKAQLDEMGKLVGKEYVDVAKAVLQAYGYNKSSEVLASDYDNIMHTLEQAIKAKEMEAAEIAEELEPEDGEVIDIEGIEDISDIEVDENNI